MDYLPIFIAVQGAPAIVVGGGQVAHRKVEWLLAANARVTVIAPVLGEELARLAAQGAVQHIAAAFAGEQLRHAALAIAATDSGAVNAAVARAARAARVPINVVDNPELSSFIFPAIIDRSPVIVAVGSGGRSPVLVRRLRAQIEALLPAKLGALARFMGERRTAVKLALTPGGRRPFWERIIGGAVGSQVLAGNEARAQEAFATELSGSSGRAATGEVYLIGAGPGDPDLLTLRALQLLQQADIILYDRLVSDAVLARARRDAQRVFVGKEPGDSQHAQARIHELMIHHARAGLRVARLKGGDPFIFGRGGEEIEALAANGIAYLIVPGITAALGAAASAGIPLTHRRLAQSVTFAPGHALDDETLDWDALARPNHTVVFYMGVAHLSRILARLRASGAAADHPAAIIERATLPGERVLSGTLATLEKLAADAAIATPALLIVGQVAAFARAPQSCARGVELQSAGPQEVPA
ncbi:MAG TPA: siroheme synthase CysG [Steroidobacteraceae bacterium]|jgi:uroporphyrin-III C-methyltransferase/precorrin-2 dehydrogenase/sirohydrochlorin ferrochelatase|nr:siroheme synthase CysG [Steroidobacteraceae bacterium]